MQDLDHDLHQGRWVRNGKVSGLRMKLNLVDSRHDIGVLKEALQPRKREVGDT